MSPTMYDDAMPVFIADGVSQESLETLVRLVEPRLQQNPIVEANTLSSTPKRKLSHQPQIMVCANPTERIFSRKALTQFAGIFELTENREMGLSVNLILDLLQSGTWFASVSSNHIYNGIFVDQLCQKIALKNNVDQADQELMRTAIEEALCNGVVHGNLELESPPMESIDKFTAFYTEINERLKISKYGDRHITFQTWTTDSDIWVSVTDEGLGYEPSIENQTPEKIITKNITKNSLPKKKNRSGRGLGIIRSLAKEVRVDLRGRRLAMRF